MNEINELIPDVVLALFNENPNIGRRELATIADISESDARIYCKLLKKRQENVKIVDVGIVLADIHHPFHNKASISCAFQAIKNIKPSILILLGDQMDMNTISTFNKKKPKLVENSRIQKDYKLFIKEIFQPLNDILPKNCKKIWLDGNHEERVDRLLDADPKLTGLIEVENNIDLSNWTYKKYKEVYQIGHMHFTHGLYYNRYHAEKNVRIYQKNMITGHCHTFQVYTSVSPVNALPKQGISIGSLCDRNPFYKENEPNRWLNQIMVFYILSDGTFRYETPTILHGRMIFNGKIYDGNVKKDES